MKRVLNWCFPSLRVIGANGGLSFLGHEVIIRWSLLCLTPSLSKSFLLDLRRWPSSPPPTIRLIFVIYTQRRDWTQELVYVLLYTLDFYKGTLSIDEVKKIEHKEEDLSRQIGSLSGSFKEYVFNFCLYGHSYKRCWNLWSLLFITYYSLKLNTSSVS